MQIQHHKWRKRKKEKEKKNEKKNEKKKEKEEVVLCGVLRWDEMKSKAPVIVINISKSIHECHNTRIKSYYILNKVEEEEFMWVIVNGMFKRIYKRR